MDHFHPKLNRINLLINDLFLLFQLFVQFLIFLVKHLALLVNGLRHGLKFLKHGIFLISADFHVLLAFGEVLELNFAFSLNFGDLLAEILDFLQAVVPVSNFCVIK